MRHRPVLETSHYNDFRVVQNFDSGVTHVFDAWHDDFGVLLPEKRKYGETQFQVVILESFDRMSDSDDVHKAVGPCEHFVVKTALKPVSGSHRFSEFGGFTQWFDGLYVNFSYADAVANAYNLRLQHPVTLRDAHLKWAADFKDQLPSKTNILNFTYELKELLTTLPEAIYKLKFSKRAGRKVLPKGGKEVRPGFVLNKEQQKGWRAFCEEKRIPYRQQDRLKSAKRRKTISGADIGDSFLAYDYGLKPLVSDIQNLINTGNMIDAGLAKLRAQQGKTVKLRRRQLNAFSFDETYDYDSGIERPKWDREGWRVRRRYKADIYASTERSQSIEGLDNANSKWRAAMQVLGVTSPIEAWWNAIPFSFIVDWAVPVGDWLHLFGMQPFFGVWSFSNTQNTVREVTRLDFTYHDPTGIYPDQDGGYVEIVNYSRVGGMDLSYEDLLSGLGNLTFNNIADAVALMMGTQRKH